MFAGLSDRTLQYIYDRIQPYTRLFEWGAGESTLAFAERCAFVASVEHAVPFYENVKARLRDRGLKNCHLILEPPEPSPGEMDYASKDYPQHSFRRYVRVIDHYAKEPFHIIVVDGRCRARCFDAGMETLAPGGFIVLDDAERYAQMIAHTVSGWSCDSWSSGSPDPKWTMVWQKPKSA